MLKKLGKPELAKQLDNMLAEDFTPDVFTNLSIKEALKLLADKVICHYDNVANENWALVDYIDKQLRNPYEKVNLDYIIGTITSCIGEGLYESI